MFVRPCYDVLWRQIQSQLIRIHNETSLDESRTKGGDDDKDHRAKEENDDEEEEEEERNRQYRGKAKKMRSSASEVKHLIRSEATPAQEELAIQESGVDSPQVLLYAPPIQVPRWIVTGTPGIGKSCFGLYLLWKLRTSTLGSRRSILYRPVGSPVFYVFQSDGSEGVLTAEPTAKALRPLLQNLRTVVIVDAVEPPLCFDALTILITSPRRDVYWTFSKSEGTTFRFMPVFSLDEMLKCRHVSFSETVGVETVHALFARWGGVVRFVLQKASDSTQQALLESALESVNLKMVQEAIGSLDAADDVCHRLIHVDVTDLHSLMHKRAQIASMYVAERVIDHLVRTECDALLSFLRASAGEPITGGLRGNLFEAYAHRIIRCGGNFSVRTLDASKLIAEWTIPACDAYRFASLKQAGELQLAHSRAYLQPLVTNLAAVDSVAVLPPPPSQRASTVAAAPVCLPSVIYFQMTMVGDNPVLADAFKTTVQALPSPDKAIPLVFVVPHDRFDSFKAQNFLGTKSTKAKPVVVSAPKIECSEADAAGTKRPRKSFHTIVQYALRIRLGPETQLAPAS